MGYDELSETLKVFGEKVKADFGKEYPDKHLSSSIGVAISIDSKNDHANAFRKKILDRIASHHNHSESYVSL